MSPRPALPLRLEYVLLGLIRRQPVHGYELMRIWNQPHAIGSVWQIKPGPLYATLEKLEQLGFLECKLVSGDASPTRKEYHVTQAGERSFLSWMQTPVPAARDFRQDFLAKLFFSSDIERDALCVLFERQEELCQHWLSSLQKQINDGSGFEKQVFTFRIRQVQCILDWMQEIKPKP